MESGKSTVDVDRILKAESSRYKTTDVKKDILPDVDVGNLLLFDRHPVDIESIG